MSMHTPEDFPYIRLIHVISCFTYHNFDIKLYDYKNFSNLILTGRNGSGKSTILNAINKFLMILNGFDPEYKGDPNLISDAVYQNLKSEYITGSANGWSNIDNINLLTNKHQELSHIRLYDNHNFDRTYADKYKKIDNRYTIFNSFTARRFIYINETNHSIKHWDFINAMKTPKSGEFINRNFQQYLFKKIIDQHFNKSENEDAKDANLDNFFKEINSFLKTILYNEYAKLKINRDDLEVEIEISNYTSVKLKSLPEGISGLISVFFDLFIRVDIIRGRYNSKMYNPCGIVLLDEPEAHLHLELQEQILPLLTRLFPNIQFIIATHSPAVTASIRNATIFDLTTKENRNSEETVGRSYSELSIAHFGLNNDYSTIADEYMNQIDSILNEYKNKPKEIKQRLIEWQKNNSSFLSQTLQIKLEYIIAQQDAKIYTDK